MSNEVQNRTSIQDDVKLIVEKTYNEWLSDLVKLMKSYPLVHNKWKTSKFKTLHKKGYTIRETFRIWFLNHM